MTYGHIDVIERAARLVDELIVAVLGNSGKTPLFTVEERKDMLREVTKHIPNAVSYTHLVLRETVRDSDFDETIHEVGTVRTAGDGIVSIDGLDHAMYGEVVQFEDVYKRQD